MRGAMFNRQIASILAFGHTGGLYSMGRGHRRSTKDMEYRPLPTRPIIQQAKTPAAPVTDAEVNYQNHPDIYRALHPIFSARQTPDEPVQEQAEVAERLQAEMTPSGNTKPATWTWEVTR